LGRPNIFFESYFTSFKIIPLAESLRYSIFFLQKVSPGKRIPLARILDGNQSLKDHYQEVSLVPKAEKSSLRLHKVKSELFEYGVVLIFGDQASLIFLWSKN